MITIQFGELTGKKIPVDEIDKMLLRKVFCEKICLSAYPKTSMMMMNVLTKLIETNYHIID